MKIWEEHEEIVKETIFEFLSLYGASAGWTVEINKIFHETIEKKIKELNKT